MKLDHYVLFKIIWNLCFQSIVTSSFKNWSYTLNVHVGNLMVIHDQEKINISFCTYSKRLKKYIYVICIFCKLEKKYSEKEARSIIHGTWISYL